MGLINTEEQLRIILKSDKIFENIITQIDRGLCEATFEVEGINIVFKCYRFENNDTFELWLAFNSEKCINGYYPEEQKLYLTVLVVDNNLDSKDLKDTITQEVEHYFQTKKEAIIRFYRDPLNKGFLLD